MLHEISAINHLILCRLSGCVIWKPEQPECDVIYVETFRLNVRDIFSIKESCVEVDTEFTSDVWLTVHRNSVWIRKTK